MIPANNISKIHASPSGEMYRATCGCLADNHSHTIVIDDDDGIISCSIYSDMKYYDWATSDSGFFAKVKSRIKAVYNILVHGYLTFEGEFMFASDEAARDYANAILAAVDKHNK